MSMKVATAFAGCFVVLAVPAHAQDGAAPGADVEAVAATVAADADAEPAVLAAAPPASLLLPAATEIILTPDAEANSKKLREGHSVPMHTLFDVMHNGVVVIPKGTRGTGTVTWRTGKGAFGKSAKMEITFNELTLPNGKRLPLSGMHRQEGQGNTGAAVGAVVAVGVFGAFVTGKSAIVPVGQHLTARTGEALPYVVPAGAKIVPTAELAPTAPAATATDAAMPDTADADADADAPVTAATPAGE